jgi:hypothetical protein
VVGTSPEFTVVLPLFLFTLLVVVQLRHYTVTHVGFLTRQRAALQTRRFIEDYALSPLEKDLVREKKQTARLIEATFTVNIYPRGLCPC